MELLSEAADFASSFMSDRLGPVGDARARSCSGDTLTPAFASSLEETFGLESKMWNVIIVLLSLRLHILFRRYYSVKKIGCIQFSGNDKIHTGWLIQGRISSAFAVQAGPWWRFLGVVATCGSAVSCETSPRFRRVRNWNRRTVISVESFRSGRIDYHAGL